MSLTVVPVSGCFRLRSPDSASPTYDFSEEPRTGMKVEVSDPSLYKIDRDLR